MADLLDSLLSEFGPVRKNRRKPAAELSNELKARKAERAAIEAEIEEMMWRPCGRAVLVLHQICRDCGHTQSIVGGQFLMLQHSRDKSARRTVAQWRIPFDESLPLERQDCEEEVDHCPSCLNREILAQAILERPRQFQLQLVRRVA